MAHKNPVGRPKTPTVRRRSQTIAARFTEPEGALIRAAAADESATAKQRVTPSSLVRRIVLAHFAAEMLDESGADLPARQMAA